MAFNLSSLNKQLSKMSPSQRAKFQRLLKKNKEAAKKVADVAKTSSRQDRNNFNILSKKPSNKEIYNWNKENLKVKKPIDDMTNQERPAELAGREVPYNFKGESKPWTKPAGGSGLGTQATPQIEDEKYGYKGFRPMGEDEDPVAYENAKLKDELSSVSRWAVDAVNSQKLDIGTFKDTIQKNADMWKNKTQLNADNLLKQKAANDKAWEAVQSQFDENQAAQKAALDKLETEFIKRQSERDNLQRQYYNDVNKVLSNKAAGEGAGLTSQLSGKGLNAAMIANATAGVDKKYQERFAMAKDNHLNALKDLQNGYTDFYKSLNNSRKTLGDDAMGYIKSVYNREKTFNKDFKDLKDAEVNGIYTPMSEMLKKTTATQTDQIANTAKKSEKAAEYEAASPELRRNILLDNLVKVGGKMEMTDLDMNILETAAGMGSFSKALMYIAKQGKAAANSGDDSNIGNYIKDKGVNGFIKDAINGVDTSGGGGESTTVNEDKGTKSDVTTSQDATSNNSGVDVLTEGNGFEGVNAMLGKDPSPKVAAFDKLKSEKVPASIMNWVHKQVHVGMDPEKFNAMGTNSLELAGKYKYVTQLLGTTLKDIATLKKANNIPGAVMTDDQANKIKELQIDAIKLKKMQRNAASDYVNMVTGNL